MALRGGSDPPSLGVVGLESPPWVVFTPSRVNPPGIMVEVFITLGSVALPLWAGVGHSICILLFNTMGLLIESF